MTIDDAITTIREHPIHWQTTSCDEVCLQISEQLPSAALSDALSQEAKAGVGQPLSAEQQQLIQSHRAVLDAVSGFSNGPAGYLLWAYMVEDALRHSMQSGAYLPARVAAFFSTHNEDPT